MKRPAFLQKTSVEDIMKMFHEEAFQSTGDYYRDYNVSNPDGDIIALT